MIRFNLYKNLSNFYVCFLFIITFPVFATDLELQLLKGDINPVHDTRFIKIPAKWSTKTIYVQEEVVNRLVEMFLAAQQEGVSLKVMSGFRSYEAQRLIWERKWKAHNTKTDQDRVDEILLYSSMPGTSRHHWGTDIDLVSVNPLYWQSTEGQVLYKWLQKNAKNYGFCQPYAGKMQGLRKEGYEDEPWHWSYYSLALPLQRAREENINELFQQALSGMDVLASQPDRIKAYISSVNTSCIQ